MSPGLMRRALLALLLYIVAPLLLLAVAEVALRMAGVGESTAWLQPRACEPQVIHTPSRAFYQQFSNIPLRDFMNWDELDFVVPDYKEPNVYRIFAFGESAFFGDRSAARMVEVMLADRFPNMRIELYNASCPGMNSHVLRAAAEVAANHQPDLYLIYMGNNEAVGPYGPNSMVGRSALLWRPAAIQSLIALNDLRLVQALTAQGSRPWAAATPEQLAASVPGPVDEAQLNFLFADNLRAMIASAHSAGAAVVVSTLSHNRAFGKSAPPKPEDPIVHSGTNRSVLDAAKAEGVFLADVDLALHRSAPSGVPDYSQFTDNIHYRFEGAHAAACAMYLAVLEAMPAALRGEGPPPLTMEEVAARLAWSPAAEKRLLRIQIDAGFDEASKDRLRARLAELEAKESGDEANAWVQGYADALELRPEDPYLLHGYFEALQHAGRHEESLAAAKRLLELHPCARLSLRNIARAYAQNGRIEEARAAFERTLEHYPDDEPARVALELMVPAP